MVGLVLVKDLIINKLNKHFFSARKKIAELLD